MKISLDIGAENGGEMVSAIVAEMEKRGLVVPVGGRKEPYSVSDILDLVDHRVSKSTVERLFASGVLRKLPGSSRLVATAKSVNTWLEGEVA